MARRYLMRPQCGQRFRLDTWTDTIMGPCLMCDVAAGSPVTKLLQTCETCTAVPNHGKKEQLMSKSKQNGGSDSPMLPTLDQLPALPGFAVPAGHPAVPQTQPPPSTETVPTPQVQPNPPQETTIPSITTVETPVMPPIDAGGLPPIPSTEMPAPTEMPSQIQPQSEIPPMPEMVTAMPEMPPMPEMQPVQSEPVLPPIIEPSTGEVVNMQKTVRLKPEEQALGFDPFKDTPGLPGLDDVPAMPGMPETPDMPEPEIPAPPKPELPTEPQQPVPAIPTPIEELPPMPEPNTVPIPDPTGQPMPIVEAVEPQQQVGLPHPHLRPQPQTTQQIEPPQAPAEDAFSTKSAADITLSDLISGVSGEDAVDVNAVIDKIPGLEGGPSVGGFSWHTLEPTLACWRKAYHNHVLGLVPNRSSRALNWGSLWHACWELWYKFGGQRRYDEPCDAVRQAGAPKLAGEVQRLMYIALKQYAEEEASTWDVRAVENNAVFWCEPERVDGKTVYIPISCRHDLIIAKRRPGAACHPAGPVPHGTYVCDHKTSSALTYDLTKGYAMDGQFKTNALVYLKSDELANFGPLNGIIVSVAVKHKEPGPRSLHRVETAIDPQAIEEFYQYEIKPFALEFYRRLASERYRGDRNLWPKNTTHCVNRYGCCQYFDLCDIGGYSVLESMFRVDERRKFDIGRLAEPPIEVKRASKLSDPKKKAQDETRKERTTKRKELQEALMIAFSMSAQNMDRFDSKYYIKDNNTDVQVMEMLVESLSTAWPSGRKFEYPIQDENGKVIENFELEITDKGVAWKQLVEEPKAAKDAKGKKKKVKKVTPYRGILTYKGIAEAICNDWWDLDRVDPTDGQ